MILREVYEDLYARPSRNVHGRVKGYGYQPASRQELFRSWIGNYQGTILDIGCGRGESIDTAESMGRACVGVDIINAHPKSLVIAGLPSLAELDGRTFGLVTSLDVLEHLPERDVVASLRTIAAVCENVALFSISMRSSVRNGIELHLTMKPRQWWLGHLRRVFNRVTENPGGRRMPEDVLLVEVSP